MGKQRQVFDEWQDPVILARAMRVEIDDYDQLVAIHAAAPTQVAQDDQAHLRAFIDRQQAYSDCYFLVRAVPASQIQEMIEKGRLKVKAEQEAARRRLEAEKKRQAAQEKARKLRRLKKLEGMAGGQGQA